MKRTISLIVVSFLLLLIMAGIPVASSEMTKNTFNGMATKTIIFGPGGGTDQSVSFSFEKKSVIHNATMDIRGYNDGFGNFPSNVSLDVGADGDMEYRFQGLGYGNWGHQTMFNDSSELQTLSFQGKGWKLSRPIYIPKNANVSSATIKITGKEGVDWSDNIAPNATAYGSGTPYNVIAWNDKTLTGQNAFVWCNGLGTDSSWQEYRWSSNMTIGGLGVYQFSPTGSRQMIGCKDIQYWDGSKYVSTQGYHAVNDGIYTSGQPYKKELNQSITSSRLRLYNLLGYSATGGQVSNPSLSEWQIFTGGLSGAENVSIDAGDGGPTEWNMTGVFNTSIQLPDISSNLNTILAAAPVAFTDPYGNQMAAIRLNLTADTAGNVVLSNISIEYNYTATADFATELQSHIPQSGNGNVSVIFSLTSTNGGRLDLSNLDIDFEPPNRAPDFIELPSDYSLDEDTKVDELIPLDSYFNDDRDPSSSLTFTVEDQTMGGQVNAYIQNGTFLGVDATVVENWNGEFTLRIRATDSGGKYNITNPFNITVRPVNDEPVPQAAIPDINMDEDTVNQGNIVLNSTISMYFSDVEDDTLFFDLQLDPEDILGTIPVSAELYSTGTATSSVRVNSTDNWFGTVVLRIYADDDPVFNRDENPYHDLNITVNPVNDPPVWIPINDVHMDEDTILDNYVTLTDMVTDVDDVVGNITFDIKGYTNSTGIKVSLDDGNSIDIRPMENWTGRSTVTLEADDSDTVETTFTIFVDPVNDAPGISILSLVEHSILKDTVTISGTAFDREDGLEKVEVRIGGGSWEEATGTELWSYELDTGTLSNGNITIEARSYDGEAYSDIVLVHVAINNPIFTNAVPVITVTSHVNGSSIFGIITLEGSVTDTDGDVIASVEFRVGENPWTNITDSLDSGHWNVELDTGLLAEGTLDLEFRASDGTGWGLAYLWLEKTDAGTNVTDGGNGNNTNGTEGGNGNNTNGTDGTDGGSGGTGSANGNSHWWIFIVIALIVILVFVIAIIMAVVIVSKKKKGKKQETASTPEPEPETVVETAPMYREMPLTEPVQEPGMPYMGEAIPMGQGYDQPMLGQDPYAQPMPMQADLYAPPPMPGMEPVAFLPPARPQATGEVHYEDPVGMPEPQPVAAEGLSLSNELEGLFNMEGTDNASPDTSGPEVVQVACHNCGELMEVTVTYRPMSIVCWNCNAEGLIE